LDKFIAFSQEHLDLLTGEFMEHYHHERPHQGKGNVPLTRSLQAEAKGVLSPTLRRSPQSSALPVPPLNWTCV
jgi:hypothetical protein